MRTFGGNQIFAYDVGCTFSATIAMSKLAEKAKDLNFKSCTGAFHGAAHNRSCQLGFLIGLTDGAGLEDGEGNERVFSSSNSLAAVTRHSSTYYRQMRVHIHFNKWDEEKYEHLGEYFHFSTLGYASYTQPYILLAQFLINNHLAAWKTIHESQVVLDATKRMHPDFDAEKDCKRWLEEEKTYLSSLKKEPPRETAKIRYLEALEDLEKAECVNPALSL
jgi:Kyakuja-Dileera-Zisupton transposase